MLWAFGGAETDTEPARRSSSTARARVESVKFMQAFWKECCDEGGPGLGRHQQQPGVPRRRDLAPRSTAPRSTSWPSARRTRSRTTSGEPLWQDIDHAPLPAGPAGAYLLFLNQSHAIMKYSKNPKLAKDFLRLAAQAGELRQVVHDAGGLLGRLHQEVGERSHVGQARRAARRCSGTAARNTRLVRLRGPVDREGHRGASPSTSSRTCTPRRVQGMAAEDAVKWAEGELEEDLRRLTVRS